MSRRLRASLISALLVVALPGALSAQADPADADPMWAASAKPGGTDVAPLGDGFLLVGGKDKPTAGKVWISSDGSDWARLRDDDVFDGAYLQRVAAFGDGAVALGTDARKLVGFFSPDGTTWQKGTIDKARKGMELFPQAVTDGPAGLIAVASLVGQDFAGQRWYGSTDGQDWQEIDAPSAETNGMFVSLVSTDEEYIAVARPMFGPGTDLYQRSADGVVWESFEGPVEGNIHDLAVGADGTYVAVGQDTETFESAIWRAQELGDWERVYTAPSTKETEERLDVVAVGGPGFLAGGSTSTCPEQSTRSCPALSILASADGLEWSALGVEDGVPGPLHETSPRAISTNGGSTAIVIWHERRPVEAWTLPATP